MCVCMRVRACVRARARARACVCVCVRALKNRFVLYMKMLLTPFLKHSAWWYFAYRGIAQLVLFILYCPAEKPPAILTRVRVPGAASDLFPRVSCQCRLFYGVRTASLCNRLHQHPCTRQKRQTSARQPYRCLESTAHTDRN